MDDCGLLHPPVHMTKDPFKPSKVIYYHAMQQILHRTSILASLNQHSGIAAGTSSHSRSHTSNPAGKDDISGHENDNIHCIEGAGDRENILTEAKFIEAIVRIANLRFQMHDSLCDRFEAFCDEEVLQRAKQVCVLVRMHSMYRSDYLEI